jgi:hypothetical protein
MEPRILSEIATQLSRRTPAPETIWGDDKIKQKLANLISDTCSELSGWPKGRLYPQDPFRLILFEDLADVDVSTSLRHEFGLDVDLQPLMNLTFGEAIDVLFEIWKELNPLSD